MRKFHDSRKMPYSAELINSIIIDVEKYPEFLPWCTDAYISKIGENYFIAELKINFKGFTSSYESRVIYQKNNNIYTIDVEAISGPFKTLINKWTIKTLKDWCLVDFFIDFEFKSMILDKLVGIVFSVATEKMINAFESRAKEISDETS